MAVAVELPKVKSNDPQPLWDSVANLSKEQIQGNYKLREKLTQRLDKNPSEVDCIIKFLETKPNAIPDAVTLLVNAIDATKDRTQATIVKLLLANAAKEEPPGVVTKFITHRMFSIFTPKVVQAILEQNSPTPSTLRIIDAKYTREDEQGIKFTPTDELKSWLQRAATYTENPGPIRETAFRIASELDPKFAEQNMPKSPTTKEELIAEAKIIGKSFELASNAAHSEKVLGSLLSSKFTLSNQDIETLLSGDGKFAAFLFLPKCTENLSEQTQAGLLNLTKRGGFSPAVATENALAWAKHNPNTAAKFLIEIGGLHGTGKEIRDQLTTVIGGYSLSTIEKSFNIESLRSNPQKAETLIQALLKVNADPNQGESKRLIAKLLKFTRPEFISATLSESKVATFPPDVIGTLLYESRRIPDPIIRQNVVTAVHNVVLDDSNPAFREELKKFFQADGEIKSSKQIEETGLRMLFGFKDVDKVASIAFQNPEIANPFIKGLNSLTYSNVESIRTTAIQTVRKALDSGNYAPTVEPLLVTEALYKIQDLDKLKKFAQSENLETVARAFHALGYIDGEESIAVIKQIFTSFPEKKQKELVRHLANSTIAEILQPEVTKILSDREAGNAAYTLLACFGTPKAEALNNPDFIKQCLLDLVRTGSVYSQVKILFNADSKFKAAVDYENAKPKDADMLLEVIKLAPEKDQVELAANAYFRSINRYNYPKNVLERLTAAIPSITEEKLLTYLATNSAPSTEEQKWAIRLLAKTKPEYVNLAAQQLVDYYQTEKRDEDSGIIGHLEVGLTEAAKAQNKTVATLLKEILPETAESKKLIALYARAEKINIQLPLRISPEQRESVFRTLENPPQPSEGKKIAVVIITRSDYNLAFYGRVKSFFEQAAANGEEVIWREVENPVTEFKGIFSDPRLKGSDLTVIFAGHGSHQGVSFGEIGGSDYKLNRSVSADLGRLDLLTQAKRIRVLLDSCQTGRHERYVPPISYSLRKNNFPSADFIAAPVVSPTREEIVRQPQDKEIRGVLYDGNLENELQTD